MFETRSTVMVPDDFSIRVSDELDHILASKEFQRSPTMSRLLTFLVDHRLVGNAHNPKAYAIAVEALGKPADFDPQTDSYPRVMMGRLRAMIQDYYQFRPGEWRIDIPVGQYGIVLLPDDGTEPLADEKIADAVVPTKPSPISRGASLWIVLVISFASLTAWLLWPKPLEPSVNNAPSLSLEAPEATGEAAIQIAAKQIEGGLRDGFRRFSGIRLQGVSDATESEPDYRLRTSVSGDADQSIVTIVLDRSRDNQTIWTDQQHIKLSSESVNAVVTAAVSRIARGYGVISVDQLADNATAFSPGYLCLAQYHRFRYLREATTIPKLESCLALSRKLDPKNSDYLEAQSFLLFAKDRMSPNPLARKEGRAAAEAALNAQPNNAMAVYAMSRADFFGGDCPGGKRVGQHAIALNPYDPDIVEGYGSFLAGCLDPAAIIHLKRAIVIDPDNALLARSTLAFLELRAQHPKEAIAILDGVAPVHRTSPQILFVNALALAQMGNVVEGRKVWQSLSSRYGIAQGAPTRRTLERFITAPLILTEADAEANKYFGRN